jgi:hypothetical protein
MIDALVAWYHPIRGAIDITPNLPVTFDRKLEYLNKMARDDGFGDVGKKNIRTLKIEAKRLNFWRKTLIHGMVFHQSHFGTDWEVQIRRFHGPTSSIDRYAFKDADLREILSQMSRFSHAISPWIAGMTRIAE